MPNGKSGTGGQELGFLGKLGDIISLAFSALSVLGELKRRHKRGAGREYFAFSDWLGEQRRKGKVAEENVLAILRLLMDTPGYRQHLSFLSNPERFYRLFMGRMEPVPSLRGITMGELEDALGVLRQLMPPKES